MHQTVTVHAYERGLERFTWRDVSGVEGERFPVTDAKGNEIGEGRIVRAALLDLDGTAMVLRYEIPDELALKPIEPEVGRLHLGASGWGPVLWPR